MKKKKRGKIISNERIILDIKLDLCKEIVILVQSD